MRSKHQEESKVRKVINPGHKREKNVVSGNKRVLDG
jgi:hypothetical protein